MDSNDAEKMGGQRNIPRNNKGFPKFGFCADHLPRETETRASKRQITSLSII